MRAIGGPEVLELAEVPTPEPAEGEVLIKVRAVSINRSFDLGVRAGTYVLKPPLPHILGADPSGTIVAVGQGVEPARLGQRVVVVGRGPSGAGGYAEFVAVPEACAIPIPDQIDFPAATCIARHVPTAFHLLEVKANVRPGEWVLIMGAAGGLGNSALQVAKLHKARVIAGASTDKRVRNCLEYGAEQGVNYREQDLAAEVMRITAGHGADIVVENIADPTLWPGAFESLASGGRLVTAGAHGGGVVPLDVRQLYLKRLTIMGTPESRPTDVQRALDAAASGTIRASIGCVLPLAAAAEAHRLVETNEVIGKLVLQPDL